MNNGGPVSGGTPFLAGREEGPELFIPLPARPVIPSSGWHRPIHPAHAVAFVGGCAVAGFVIGIGLAAMVGAMVARKVVDAIG